MGFDWKWMGRKNSSGVEWSGKERIEWSRVGLDRILYDMEERIIRRAKEEENDSNAPMRGKERRKEGRKEGRKEERMEGRRDGRKKGRKEGWMDGWMDGWRKGGRQQARVQEI